MEDGRKKTERQREIKRDGKSWVTTGFTINDVPLNLFKRFISDIQLYNDIYWVKLMDLMRKAEAYDAMVGNTEYSEPEENEVSKPEEKEGKDFVQTMGGEMPFTRKGE